MELITLLVAGANGLVAVHAFGRGLQFWGWMNLIFSAANAALFMKYVL